MNEFTAGSAFITHASVGSERTGLYQIEWEATGEICTCIEMSASRDGYVTPDWAHCRFDEDTQCYYLQSTQICNLMNVSACISFLTPTWKDICENKQRELLWEVYKHELVFEFKSTV